MKTKYLLTFSLCFMTLCTLLPAEAYAKRCKAQVREDGLITFGAAQPSSLRASRSPELNTQRNSRAAERKRQKRAKRCLTTFLGNLVNTGAQERSFQ